MLDLENASLNFEIQGKGPLLLFIAGARGSGTTDFNAVADKLGKSFSVLTYDRRGYSKSPISGEQDYSRRLERDADDAAELIQHVVSTLRPESAVYVFGTSSGAIVALNLLCRHPSLVTKLIAHEPPWHNALSDDEGRDELVKTQQMYDLYRAKGVHAALRSFSSVNFTPKEIAAFVARAKEGPNPYDWGNILYWFERELLVYPFADAPWDILQKPEVKERLILGVSIDGGNLPAGRVAKKMAGRLGPDVAVETFPGGHLPYFTDVEPFTTQLTQVLITQPE